MKQVSIGEFKHKLSVTHLREWLPCQIVSDGEVIAVVGAPDVTLTKWNVRKGEPRPVYEVTQVEVPLPASVTHLVKHGNEVPQRRVEVTQKGVLPFDKRKQAQRSGFNS